MNEGIAKALRRDTRAKGYGIRRPDGTMAVPGNETKALWRSLSHKERGQWRRRLAPTRAAQKRAAVRASIVHFIEMARSRSVPRDYQVHMALTLATGRLSYSNARAMVPRA